MVRQAYLHRMVLGRSPYESPATGDSDQTSRTRPHRERRTLELPLDENSQDEEYVQQYDSRGHPENRLSRQLGRRSMRAQNDVLATIGVCVSVDEHNRLINLNDDTPNTPAETRQAQLNVSENLAGFKLSMTEFILSGLVSTWCTNLRRRIMTFDFYLSVPLATIASSEWKHLGPLRFLFAGLVPSAVLHIFANTIEGALEVWKKYLIHKFVTNESSPDKARRNRRLIRALEILSTCGKFCFVIAPLQFLITLQRLDLVSPWIPLPRMTGVSFFTLLLPKRPTAWTQILSPAYLRPVALSPLGGLALSTYIATIMDHKLTVYANAAVPRPDNPDVVSYKTDTFDEDYSELQVTHLSVFQSSVRSEMIRDYHAASSIFNSFFRLLCGGLKRAVGTTSGFLKRPQSSASEGLFLDNSSAGTTSATIVNAGQASSGSISIENGNVIMTPVESPIESNIGRFQPGIDRHTFPMSRQTSGSTSSSELEPSNVQVRARPGSTSTLHMDLEVNAPVPNTSGPVYTSTFAASPHRNPTMTSYSQRPPDAPLHRVTALSLYSWSSLSLQLSTLANVLIRLPLTSLFQRSIAEAYITAQGNPNLGWVRRSIYSPLGPTIGQYGWAGVGIYACQVLLCLGLETASGLFLWRAGNTAAFAMGRRYFAWGEL